MTCSTSFDPLKSSERPFQLILLIEKLPTNFRALHNQAAPPPWHPSDGIPEPRSQNRQAQQPKRSIDAYPIFRFQQRHQITEENPEMRAPRSLPSSPRCGAHFLLTNRINIPASRSNSLINNARHCAHEGAERFTLRQTLQSFSRTMTASSL
jgi:hypothetical protein